MDIVAVAMSKRYTDKRIVETVPLLADLPEKVAALDEALESADEVLDQIPVISDDATQEHRVLEVNDIDPTLSVSGKVADAKIVGDRLAEICEALKTLGIDI